MRKATTKVDVFSFGIIIIEFLTRRRPTGLAEEDGLPISLRDIVQKTLAGGMNQQVLEIVDPMLVTDEEHNEGVLVELLKLSLCCTLPNPEDRPDMNEVLSVLMMLKTAR